MVLYEVLVKIGLNKKEAQIYLACLELGPSAVLPISLKAQVPRGSCYDLLEGMFERGFVTKIDTDKHVIFIAVDPDALLRRTEESVRHFELALPELKGLYHQHVRPQVRYFAGVEGIKRVYRDTLTATTEILNYANSREIRLLWPAYDEEYVAQRVKKGIFLKGIAPDDAYGKEVKKHDVESLREIRLLSAQEFHFTNEINIYDNKVAITSFHNELIGILIESAEIADTQRDIFKMAWAFAGMNK